MNLILLHKVIHFKVFHLGVLHFNGDWTENRRPKKSTKKPGIGGVEPGQRNIYVDLISVPFSKYFLAN